MTTATPIEDQLRRWADELGDRVDAGTTDDRRATTRPRRRRWLARSAAAVVLVGAVGAFTGPGQHALAHALAFVGFIDYDSWREADKRVDAAVLSRGGRTIMLTIIGGAPYEEGDACTEDIRAFVEETPSQVIVRIEHRTPMVLALVTSCDDEGFPHEVSLKLDAPLGDRVVRAGEYVVRVERR